MFGYVSVNQQELKIKEFERYRGYYCGVCHSLKERHGRRGQITLSYDMTFLSLLLNALYEEPLQEAWKSCFAHPMKKHLVLKNAISDYVADMNILLSYYGMLDHWKDEKKLTGWVGAKLLERKMKKLKLQYPRQSEAVASYIENLTDCERKNSMDLDLAAGLTGTMLGEIFVYREDIFKKDLRKMGFYLGKFIYLMDAYEDVAKDIKKDNYNPWKAYKDKEGYEEKVQETLTMMMEECAKAFERLPIIEDAELLRNILYSGVWTKYDNITRKKDV